MVPRETDRCRGSLVEVFSHDSRCRGVSDDDRPPSLTSRFVAAVSVSGGARRY
jgi:hypothetical protein